MGIWPICEIGHTTAWVSELCIQGLVHGALLRLVIPASTDPSPKSLQCGVRTLWVGRLAVSSQLIQDGVLERIGERNVPHIPRHGGL